VFSVTFTQMGICDSRTFALKRCSQEGIGTTGRMSDADW